MASSNLLVVLAIAAVVFPSVTMATEYWVGDSKGWTVNVDYQAWASDKMFMVGDVLVFNYTKGAHNVFKVNGTSFASCSVPPANEALNSGLDKIPLASPGNKWYICGFANHCSEKMQKLKITVMSMDPPAPAPSSAFALVKSGYQALIAVMAVFALIVVV
ncbi:hypothetical protein LguiA_022507 [Lonicera macranthoides]